MKSQRVRLFKNERLEQLTLIGPHSFTLIWGLVLPLVAWSGWGATDFAHGFGLFVAGFVVWGLCEYALHRYLFHWSVQWPPMKSIVFLIHGNHHTCPNDRMRNLMPAIVSVPVAIGIWFGFRAGLGPAGSWLVLGFLCGYVVYDAIHFACHQASSGGALFMALKRHHLRHHYVNDAGNYAISTIFWDRVFGSKIP